MRLVEVVVSRLSSVPRCIVLTVVSWVVYCNSWPVDGFVNSKPGTLRAFVLKKIQTDKIGLSLEVNVSFG